jgi:Flp pilus assembly protein TadG
MRGTALMEFALAWPVALLLVLGTVEAAVWAAESFAARSAALAGARAGAIAGTPPDRAADVTLRTLSPSLVGVTAAIWCPGQSGRPPTVWVCATDLGPAIQVDVGGSAPALVPIVSWSGIPLRAHVVLEKESFAR